VSRSYDKLKTSRKIFSKLGCWLTHSVQRTRALASSSTSRASESRTNSAAATHNSHRCIAAATYRVTLSSTSTHNHLMALCPGLPGWAGTRRNCLGFTEAGEDGVAVASTGPYAASPAPDKQTCELLITQCFLRAGCSSCHPTNSVKAQKVPNNLQNNPQNNLGWLRILSVIHYKQGDACKFSPYLRLSFC